MGKFIIFLVFMVFITGILADYNGMLNVLKTFFVRRHVQTVTAANTCWTIGKYTYKYNIFEKT